jgi:hypothetical protein
MGARAPTTIAPIRAGTGNAAYDDNAPAALSEMIPRHDGDGEARRQENQRTFNPVRGLAASKGRQDTPAAQRRSL